MCVNNVVNTYLQLRHHSSVADASVSTIARFSINPSLLVDAFNAAQLDLSRTDEEAEVIRNCRNELLAHYNDNASE